MIFVPNGNPPYLHISFTNNKVKTFSKLLTIAQKPRVFHALSLVQILSIMCWRQGLCHKNAPSRSVLLWHDNWHQQHHDYDTLSESATS